MSPASAWFGVAMSMASLGSRLSCLPCFGTKCSQEQQDGLTEFDWC